MARKKSSYYAKRLKSLLNQYSNDNLCIVSQLTTGRCEYCKFSVYYKDETTKYHTCCLSHPDWVYLRKSLK